MKKPIVKHSKNLDSIASGFMRIGSNSHFLGKNIFLKRPSKTTLKNVYNNSFYSIFLIWNIIFCFRNRISHHFGKCFVLRKLDIAHRCRINIFLCVDYFFFANKKYKISRKNPASKNFFKYDVLEQYAIFLVMFGFFVMSCYRIF